jgi:hypothetical protein
MSSFIPRLFRVSRTPHPESNALSMLLLVVVTALLLQVSHSSHILMLPFPYNSHVNQMTSIGVELRERGHTVTVLLSESYPELEQFRNSSGFRVVSYVVSEPDFFSWDISAEAANDWVTNELSMDPMDELRASSEG